jgi:hypothetical protein
MDDLIREMIAPERRSDLDRGRRRRLVATALIVALAAVGVTSLVTGALFTDTEPVSASDFQTGTVDIVAAHSTTQTLGSLDMAPGDVVYGVVPVSNGGSLELRYAVEVTGSNVQVADLAGQLQLDVYAGVASCDAAGVASATPIGTLDGVPITPITIVGNPAIGQDLGDRVLAAGTAENLCVSVGLPLVTDNTFQDTDAQVALTFLAEQTVNN